MDLWSTLAPFMKKLPAQISIAVSLVIVILIVSSVFWGYPLDLRSWLDKNRPTNMETAKQKVSQDTSSAPQSPYKPADNKPTFNIDHSQGIIIGDSNNVKMEFRN